MICAHKGMMLLAINFCQIRPQCKLAFSIYSKDISNIVEANFLKRKKNRVPGNVIQICVVNHRVDAHNDVCTLFFSLHLL